MTKKILSGVLLGASILSMVACSPTTGKTTKTDDKVATTKEVKEEKHDFKLVKDSSFYVTKDKKIVSENDVPEDAVIIDWYLDPFCPACVKLETLFAEQTDDLYQENVFIKYHPLSFLDTETRAGSEEYGYSVTASSYINGAAEFAPNIAIDFMNEIVHLDFRPDNGKRTEEEFFQAFLKVGGTEEQWENISKNHKDLMNENKNDTTKAFNSKGLKAKSSVNELFVPFILIGPDNMALDFETSTDSVQYVLDEISKYKAEHEKKIAEAKAKEAEEAKKAEETKTSESTTKKEEG